MRMHHPASCSEPAGSLPVDLIEPQAPSQPR